MFETSSCVRAARCARSAYLYLLQPCLRSRSEPPRCSTASNLAFSALQSTCRGGCRRSLSSSAASKLPRRSSGVTIMVLDRTILLPEDESRWTLSEGNIILWSGSVVGVRVRVGGSSLLGWASAVVRSTGARARLGLGLKLELGLGARASTGVRGRARARSRARTRAREGLRREQGGSKAAGRDGNWDSVGDSWPGPRALALRSLPLPLLTPARGRSKSEHLVCSNVHVCNLLHDNSNGTKVYGCKNSGFSQVF